MGGVIFLTPRRIGYLHLRISSKIIEDMGRGNTYRTCFLFTEAFVCPRGKIPKAKSRQYQSCPCAISWRKLHEVFCTIISGNFLLYLGPFPGRGSGSAGRCRGGAKARAEAGINERARRELDPG